MNNFDDLKGVWKNAAPKKQLQYEEAKNLAEDYKGSHIRKKIFSIVALSSVIVVFIFIFLNYEAKYITTTLGLLVAGVAVVAAIGWETILVNFLLKPIDMQADTKTFLQYWKAYQRRVEWAQKTGISIYFILLSLGIALYMFEFADRNWRYGVFFYGFTGGWILLNWFYFRPRMIRKQNQKVKALLNDAERLTSQLEE
jgi:hypothetical protein